MEFQVCLTVVILYKCVWIFIRMFKCNSCKYLIIFFIFILKIYQDK